MSELNEREERIREYLFSERDRAVIRLSAGEPITKQDISILTNHLDPDTESVVYMLSLSVLGFRQGFRFFPDEIVPRLKGLHRYYQVRNSAAAPWFQKQLMLLEGAGIPAMLTGGTAVRAYYAPDAPRLMNGYEVTVPAKDYDRALELLRDSVKSAGTETIQDRTIDGLSLIRLHKGIPHPKLTNEQDLWDHSFSTTFLNQNALIPSAEDMLLYLFCVPFGPWFVLEDRPDRSRRLYESCIVLKQGIDYEYLAKAAETINQKEVVAFYMRTLQDLIPGIIPEDAARLFLTENSYSAYLTIFENLCETAKKAEQHKKAKSNSVTAFTDRTKMHFARKRMLDFLSKS